MIERKRSTNRFHKMTMMVPLTLILLLTQTGDLLLLWHFPHSVSCFFLPVHGESLAKADSQFSLSSHERRMDQDNSALDPGLLQAVLADPVLLQAVDPRVLQAVLVSSSELAVRLSQLSYNGILSWEQISSLSACIYKTQSCNTTATLSR